ncbi:hypothetical protein M011DRAFT_11392 [Sporormia fimetaria CBS 119925]|uniref:DUF6536 domain-containing protein n=1 Tax=Sporormia fimetaria CBS 119925 TaxID=1340428 RepID=A0A6A6VRT1_9PLEO|nr:hypothetical protein M011DRAFT_11392 [Sporormia fimetaria CBS 119925]
MEDAFSGWRGGVFSAILTTSVVLVLNLAIAIVVWILWKPKGGVSTAFEGDCEATSRWTAAVHLVINILSSLLLGASNYCMQRLVAPTREEVDKAHAERRWMDIGIPGVRNLLRIDRWRFVFWVLLLLSSFPLHLFYNSIVFETIATQDTAFIQTIPRFLTDPMDRVGLLNRKTPYAISKRSQSGKSSC